MKMVMMLVLVLVGVSMGQECEPVGAVVPGYAYDEVRVADYMIVSATKGFVGRKIGWDIGICDGDGHIFTVELDDIPDYTKTMKNPDDPNNLMIGFIPEAEGVHYFLFRLTDEIDEAKYALLVNVKRSRPPRIIWIRKLLEWLFG